MDRFAALELLNWCQHSILPPPITYEEQEKLLLPLNAMESDYKIESDGTKHFVNHNNHMQEIIVYPAMWNKKNLGITTNTISISDKLLRYALPKADAMIREQLFAFA